MRCDRRRWCAARKRIAGAGRDADGPPRSKVPEESPPPIPTGSRPKGPPRPARRSARATIPGERHNRDRTAFWKGNDPPTILRRTEGREGWNRTSLLTSGVAARLFRTRARLRRALVRLKSSTPHPDDRTQFPPAFERGGPPQTHRGRPNGPGRPPTQ